VNAQFDAASNTSAFNTSKPEMFSSLGGLISWFIPDTVKRVFHPQPNGHLLIANLVLYHMEIELAKQQGMPIGEEDPPARTCPGNPFPSTQYPTCSYRSVPYVPQQLKNPGSDRFVLSPNDLLIILRQHNCTNECDIPNKIPRGLISRYQSPDKSDCELSVALPNNVEAFVYRATPSTDSQWQNCKHR
jgi:hypothetical protein